MGYGNRMERRDYMRRSELESDKLSRALALDSPGSGWSRDHTPTVRLAGWSDCRETRRTRSFCYLSLGYVMASYPTPDLSASS